MINLDKYNMINLNKYNMIDLHKYNMVNLHKYNMIIQRETRNRPTGSALAPLS